MKTPFMFRSYSQPVQKKTLKVFATMCVHRQIDPETFGSMMTLLMYPSPKFVLSRRRGDALICRARGMEASRFFLNSDADVLLFVDDDIIFKPEDATSICQEADERKAIVGGAYVLKQPGGGQFTTKLLKENKSLPFGKSGGIHEVRLVATGFMAISRAVFTELSKTTPLCKTQEGGYYPFFNPYVKEIDGNMIDLSEDWAFCEKAREAGFKVYCDTRIKLGHAGRYIYDWSDFHHGKKEDIEDFEYTERIEG